MDEDELYNRIREKHLKANSVKVRCGIMTENELFALIRENYGEANKEYLKEQTKNALSVPLLSKEETLDGLLDWVVVGGCGMNDYYRKFVYSAIGHLLN